MLRYFTGTKMSAFQRTLVEKWAVFCL